MTFVTRKITRGLTRIKRGLQKELILGNLQARRDWGHAKDYVRAMWLMLQASSPDDYVIATGEARSVLEFLNAVAQVLTMDWRDCVKFDAQYFRPTEAEWLCGDASKVRKALGWKPEISFEQMVAEMVEADLSAPA